MKKTREELGRKYRTVFIFFQKYPQTAAGDKITFGLSVLQYWEVHAQKKERIHQNNVECLSGRIKSEDEIPAQC